MHRAPGIPHALVVQRAKNSGIPRAHRAAGSRTCISSSLRANGARERAPRWLAMTAKTSRRGCLKIELVVARGHDLRGLSAGWFGIGAALPRPVLHGERVGVRDLRTRATAGSRHPALRADLSPRAGRGGVCLCFRGWLFPAKPGRMAPREFACHARTLSGHPSIFVTSFSERMDHRVKPGDDNSKISLRRDDPLRFCVRSRSQQHAAQFTPATCA